MSPVIIASVSLVGLGLLSSIILTVAAKVFYVWEDPKIAEVEDSLLGANCGGCGYAGCSAAAEAVVKGKAKADVCIAGGFDIAVAVSKVMGVSVKEKEKEISISGCRYGLKDAESKYMYSGVDDCNAAMLLFGGSKECSIGCIGLGTCVSVCPFNAIRIGENNLPLVDPDLCTGCGTCTQACPKGIINMTSNTRRMISEYTSDECTAPCQRACPAGINIPAYIQAIHSGQFDRAVEIMMEKNPFLSVCGRICPAPCENECRRNLVDQPVAINQLKKFVIDYEHENNNHVPVFKAQTTGKKVALIGGGVEGLTAAYFLARLGHEPEIFEAMPKLGGILRYVISKDRLPDDILDWEIQGIRSIGVKAHTNTVMGKDFTLDSLLNKGHDAIVFTSGGMDSKKIMQRTDRVKQPLGGIYMQLDFFDALLRDIPISMGKKVCIIEGGKKAFTIAAQCREQGAQHITIISDQAEIEQPDTDHTIELCMNSTVIGLRGKESRITHIEIQSNSTNLEQMIDTDTVIIGSGHLPELVIVPTGNTSWRTVDTFKGYSSKRNLHLFSSIEQGRISDFTAVVKAVKAGRKVAALLHNHLMGEPIVPQEHIITEADSIVNISEVNDVNVENRNIPEHIKSSAESVHTIPLTDIGFNEKTAIKEASRCLDCGLVCYTKKTKYTI